MIYLFGIIGGSTSFRGICIEESDFPSHVREYDGNNDGNIWILCPGYSLPLHGDEMALWSLPGTKSSP